MKREWQKPGHVYVLDVGTGLVKIGRSKSPSQRLRNIVTQGGFSSRQEWVSSLVRDASALESEVHRHLAPSRVVGEWFSCAFDVAVNVARECAELQPAFDAKLHDEMGEEASETLKAWFMGAIVDPGVKTRVDSALAVMRIHLSRAVTLQSAIPLTADTLAMEALDRFSSFNPEHRAALVMASVLSDPRIKALEEGWPFYMGAAYEVACHVLHLTGESMDKAEELMRPEVKAIEDPEWTEMTLRDLWSELLEGANS